MKNGLYIYKGSKITASSKEKAIKKIIASKTNENNTDDELDYMLESIIGDIKYFHIYSDKVINKVKKQYKTELKPKLINIKNKGGKWRVNCTKLFRQYFNEAAKKCGEKPQGLYYENY